MQHALHLLQCLWDLASSVTPILGSLFGTAPHGANPSMNIQMISSPHRWHFMVSSVNRHWWDGKQYLLQDLIRDNLPMMLLKSYQPFLLAWSQSPCLKPEVQQAQMLFACWGTSISSNRLEEVTGMLRGWITPEEEKKDSASRHNFLSILRNFCNTSLSAFPIYSPPCACQYTHYSRTKITLRSVSQTSSLTLSHRHHLGTVMLTHFLLYQNTRLHPEWCSAQPLPPAAAPARPQPQPSALSGQPSSISNAFCRGSGADWPNSDPLTQPLGAAPRVARAALAACSDPKTQRGSREPNGSFTREIECGIFPSLGLIGPQKCLCIGWSLKPCLLLLIY